MLCVCDCSGCYREHFSLDTNSTLNTKVAWADKHLSHTHAHPQTPTYAGFCISHVHKDPRSCLHKDLQRTLCVQSHTGQLVAQPTRRDTRTAVFMCHCSFHSQRETTHVSPTPLFFFGGHPGPIRINLTDTPRCQGDGTLDLAEVRVFQCCD